MRKLLLTLLLLTSCSRWGPDCVKIGDDYQTVVNNCGNGKQNFRAGSIFTIRYENKQTRLTVMFNGDEKVAFFEFKSPEQTITKYEEE